MAKVFSKSKDFSSSVSGFNRRKESKILPVRRSIPFGNRVRLDDASCLRSYFGGLRLFVDRSRALWSPKKRNPKSIDAKLGLSIGKAQRWWEKGLQPNMKEVTSAQDLVESLLNAGDKLVVVDFFSPGCGGCKALHPKTCQLAEMNPDVQFLQVNYEEHKSMCYSLNVHVLPFFRFYRGAKGRVCGFSCTNATIKKFKDALAKCSPDRCSLGPPKGLEEKELLALAANKDLSFTYTPKSAKEEPVVHQEICVEADTKAAAEATVPPSSDTKISYSAATLRFSRDSEEKTLAGAGSQF